MVLACETGRRWSEESHSFVRQLCCGVCVCVLCCVSELCVLCVLFKIFGLVSSRFSPPDRPRWTPPPADLPPLDNPPPDNPPQDRPKFRSFFPSPASIFIHSSLFWGSFH